MTQLKNQAELDETYGRIARRYDLLNAVMTFGLDRRVRAYASARVRPGYIVDVGTGTGVSAREIAYADRGAFVVGVDRSREMLGIAAARGAGRYVRADVRSLPFPDGVFDGAVAGFVFRPLEGDRAAIKEIYRVLKPRGRAVVYDNLGVPPGVFGFFYQIALATYIPLCAFILAEDRVPYLYFVESIRRSITARELADRFSETGFAPVKTEDMLFGTVTILTADKPAEPADKPAER